MKQSMKVILSLLPVGLGITLLFQNCSQTRFLAMKEQVQSSNSVFSSSDVFNQDLPADSVVHDLQNNVDTGVQVNNQQPGSTTVDVPVTNHTPPGTGVDVPVKNDQPGTTVDIPVTIKQPPGEDIKTDIPTVNPQPLQCGAGKVLMEGVCKAVICTQNRTSTISGGSCVETCEQQGTKYSAKSCSCQTGLTFNSITNACACPYGQAFINNSCQTIDAGTVGFGGHIQCFNKIGSNYKLNAVVSTASEIRMVVLAGAVTAQNNTSATVLYQTSKAANGKSLKQDIMDNSGFTKVSVPTNVSGEVSIIFYDPNFSEAQAVQNSNSSLSGYYVTRSVNRAFSYGVNTFTLKAGQIYENGNQLSPQLANMLFVLNFEESGDPRCKDHVSSPLVVDMRKEIKKGSKGISLTSQQNGILFDIMGLNSTPVAYTKKQISWFIEPEKYMFLALPNKNGQVNGINELFGDNTMGPDNRFSMNGYLALAKYDSNKDGVINKKDAIFPKLRLWSDLNKNGKAENDELFTLDEAGLVEIDLNYDKNYRETDKYGNLTAMRSVVKFKNGAMRLIFDLWFKHQ